MKWFIRVLGLVLIAVLLWLTMAAYKADAAALSGQLGGTGFSSTTAGNIGNCLSVFSVTPLTWTIGTCGAGGSGIVSASTSTGTNFTFSTSTTNLSIVFPTFLEGLTSTSTVATAWSLSDTAFRADNVTSLASTTGTNFTFSGSQIIFPTFLSGLTSTGTVSTAWGLSDSAYRADNVTSLSTTTGTHFSFSGSQIIFPSSLDGVSNSSTLATNFSLADSAFRAAGAGTVAGTGVADRVMLWENSVTAFSDAGLAYASGTDILTVPNVSSTLLSIGTLNGFLYSVSGLVVATGTPAGGSGGGVATSAPFSAFYIQLATTTTQLSNSTIFQSSTLIGIGTTAPSSTLHVLGGVSTTNVTVSGVTDLQSVELTNASGTALTLTGTADLQGIEFTNASGTAITLTSRADLQAVEFTNASGTAITLTGTADLQGIEFTNASGTAITLTGTADLQGIEFTNASGTAMTLTSRGDFQAIEFTTASGTSMTLTSLADFQSMEFTAASGTSMSLSGLGAYDLVYTAASGHLMGLASSSPGRILMATSSAPGMSWEKGEPHWTGFTLENASTTYSEDNVIKVFKNTSTIEAIYAVNKKSGDTVKFNLCADTNRSQSTSTCNYLIFSSYQTVTATSTVATLTANTTTIPALGVLRFITDAGTGSSTQIHVDIYTTPNQ